MISRNGYIEPVCCPDTFVTGLAYVEECAPGVMRFVFYCDQTCSLDRSAEKAICAKIVMEKGNSIESMMMALRWFNVKPVFAI